MKKLEELYEEQKKLEKELELNPNNILAMCDLKTVDYWIKQRVKLEGENE